MEQLWATSRQTSLRLVAYDAPAAGAPTAVVLHGLTTGIDVLRTSRPGVDPFARLANLGVNVVALDWPGHGRSGGRRGHLTYRLAMEAAATAVGVALARHSGPVGLVGTALGGVLAFYAALEDDRVAAVACHGLMDLRDIRPVLRRARQGALLPVAARLRHRLTEEQQAAVPLPAAAVVAAADMAEDPRLVRALRRHPQAVRSYDLASLGSILLTPEDKPDVAAQSTPVLVVIGADDHVLPESTARHVASRLEGSATVWSLPGAGHQLLLEHPTAVLPVVADWLRGTL